MDFNTALTRIVLFYAGVSLLAYIVGMFVLYLVIKSAIRDGINESGLIPHWRDMRRSTSDTKLPEIRAD